MTQYVYGVDAEPFQVVYGLLLGQGEELSLVLQPDDGSMEKSRWCIS